MLDLAFTRFGGRVGRALRSVSRRAASLWPGTTLGLGGTGAPVLSGVTVTPQSALTLTAVYAAINVISTDVAKLPYGLYRVNRAGVKKPAENDPRHRMMSTRPNREMNAMRYHQAMMGHVLGWGNAYSEIVRDASGMPVALWPLHPGTARASRTSDTMALYYEDATSGRNYAPEDVRHLAGLGFDGISGYSPIGLMRQAIGLGLAAEAFGATFFGNGATSKGILKTPKRLSEDAVKRLRRQVQEEHGGPYRAHRMMVLEDGMEFINQQIAPDDAQFLGTRQFQVLEVARMFSLPPHKIGDYSQAHLANVEESNLDYLTSTLMAWLEAIESEDDHKLLFDDERDRYGFEFDMSELMRGNMTARGTFYETMKRNGVMNADTIAGREGLPLPGPENGGNLYLVQSQNIPQQDAGKPVPAPVAKPVGRPMEPAPPEPEPEGRASEIRRVAREFRIPPDLIAVGTPPDPIEPPTDVEDSTDA